MSNYIFRVSKEGYDVSTIDKTNLILTDEYPFLKIYIQGSFSLNITGNGTFTQTITHNFGYHVAYLHLHVFDPNYTDRRYLGCFTASGPTGLIQTDSYTTINTVVMGWRDLSSGFFRSYPYMIYIYYYLFYDELV